MDSKDVIDPDTYERAWNDPPVFLYQKNNAVNQNVAPRKNVLNKRVAYPPSGSQGSNVSTSQFANKDGPPVFNMKVPPISPSMTSDTMKKETESVTEVKPCSALPDNEMIDEVKRILNSCCESSFDKNPTKIADIKRKLNLLYDSWENGSINEVVKRKMFLLCKELEEKNFGAANSIHLGLMVDYVSQVRLWMVGVKHIIRQMEVINKPEPPTETS